MMKKINCVFLINKTLEDFTLLFKYSLTIYISGKSHSLKNQSHLSQIRQVLVSLKGYKQFNGNFKLHKVINKLLRYAIEKCYEYLSLFRFL